MRKRRKLGGCCLVSDELSVPSGQAQQLVPFSPLLQQKSSFFCISFFAPASPAYASPSPARLRPRHTLEMPLVTASCPRTLKVRQLESFLPNPHRESVRSVRPVHLTYLIWINPTLDIISYLKRELHCLPNRSGMSLTGQNLIVMVRLYPLDRNQIEVTSSKRGVCLSVRQACSFSLLHRHSVKL